MTTLKIPHLRSVAALALACALAPGTPRPAAAAAAEAPAPVVDMEIRETKVRRAEVREPKLPSLRFLRDNRVFLRAQLDRMSAQTTVVRFRHATLLDERLLRLQEMSEAVAAARDTVRHEHAATDQRALLASISELGDLEAQLDLMESLLAAQNQRLSWLENDFLGRQETALVVLVKGSAGRNAPAGLVLTEENETIRVALTPEQQLALEQGGIAQIHHAFVEPRDHWFEVAFEGEAWTGHAPTTIAVTAARDKLTFLELDLGRLDGRNGTADLAATIWRR